MENKKTISKLKNVRQEHIVPVVSFLVVFVLFTITSKGTFATFGNFVNIANIAFPTVIACLGAVFIYSHGGIDFSIGAVQGLSIMVIALVMDGNMKNIVPAFIMGMITSLAAGALVATLRVVLHLPALIASLCVQSLATGILQAITMSGAVVLPVGLVAVDNTVVKLVILAIMIVLTVIIYEFTRIGKGNKSMGSNAVASSLMGVNNNAMIYFSHLLTNFAVGVSAIFYSGQISQVVATTGFGLEMDVLCAAVIGGMSLKGGTRSTILNILVGAVIVAMMTNGFALWGVLPTIIFGIKGLIFLIVLCVTHDRNKNAIIE